jgi:hypothetical protein
MNYDKLSRSLRYYYEKGIMQKVAGKYTPSSPHRCCACADLSSLVRVPAEVSTVVTPCGTVTPL